MADQLYDWYNQKASAPTTPATSPVAQSGDGMLKTVNNWQNTPDQTVQGQTQNIIRNDSPLMQMARTQGDQQSQSRGLLNSSIGIGAAQDSVYKAALPIAQADASQAARVAGYNVDTRNKADQYNATNAFTTSERQGQQLFTTSERQGRQAFDDQQRIANNDYDFAKTQLTEGNKATLQSQTIYGDLSKQYAQTIAGINADPNMTRDAKTAAIKQQDSLYRAQLSLMGNVGKIADISALLTPVASSDPKQLAADAAKKAKADAAAKKKTATPAAKPKTPTAKPKKKK